MHINLKDKYQKITRTILGKEPQAKLKRWLPPVILSLLGYLLSLLPDSFYQAIGVKVGYKIMLIAMTLSLLLALWAILSIGDSPSEEMPAKGEKPPEDVSHWVPYPEGKLLWKGWKSTMACEPMPYCVDHQIPLVFMDAKCFCPKCPGDKYLWLTVKFVVELRKMANSVLRGILDDKEIGRST